LNGRVKEDEMVYPKRVVWKEASSGHAQPPRRNPQRERVEASLRMTDGRVDRWDERTRTVHRVRAA
jgi:hypothetical protein